METQTAPARRPSNPGQHPLPGPRNTPCHPPPISAIFHDLPEKVSGFPHFCAIIGSAAYTPYQEDAEHAQTVVATRPRPAARNDLGFRKSLPTHPPGEIGNTGKHPPDRCPPQPVSTGFLSQPCVSTRGGHAGAPAYRGDRPLFPRKTTTSQPSKQTSAASPLPGPEAVPSHPSSPQAPRPIVRGPQKEATFVSQKNHHIAAFETNIRGLPCPGPYPQAGGRAVTPFVASSPTAHRPGRTEGSDLCFQ
jgi:hypothetical protein